MPDGPDIIETKSNVIRLIPEGKPQILTAEQIRDEALQQQRLATNQRRKFLGSVGKGLQTVKEGLLDTFTKKTALSSFIELEDLIQGHPDSTVRVSTTVKEQRLRHRLSVTNMINVHEVSQKGGKAGGTYIEECVINPDSGEFNPKLLITDQVLTAMDRIDRLLDINPNQKIIYTGPNGRIYNLSLSKHIDEYEELRQILKDKGGVVFEIPSQ